MKLSGQILVACSLYLAGIQALTISGTCVESKHFGSQPGYGLCMGYDEKDKGISCASNTPCKDSVKDNACHYHVPDDGKATKFTSAVCNKGTASIASNAAVIKRKYVDKLPDFKIDWSKMPKINPLANSGPSRNLGASTKDATPKRESGYVGKLPSDARGGPLIDKATQGGAGTGVDLNTDSGLTSARGGIKRRSGGMQDRGLQVRNEKLLRRLLDEELDYLHDLYDF